MTLWTTVTTRRRQTWRMTLRTKRMRRIVTPGTSCARPWRETAAPSSPSPPCPRPPPTTTSVSSSNVKHLLLRSATKTSDTGHCLRSCPRWPPPSACPAAASWWNAPRSRRPAWSCGGRSEASRSAPGSWRRWGPSSAWPCCG
ncbi:hypothetical protein CRUP_000126 [Coryphaenoides rupestris]|nr:hypothetical protein CRUP_000126 [Coryphaenoides rupestris]